MPLKQVFTVILSILACACFAQDKKFSLSAPTDIGRTGWNKVLCMKNGNTLLFHAEINKPITLKVFDSMHHEIASQKHSCKILDPSTFMATMFEGLLEINGEAVLFCDQEHMSKHGLFRLRFSGMGELLEEKKLAESPSMGTPTDFTVVGNKWEDNYAVVYCTDNRSFKKCDLHITYYNGKHEPYKDIPLPIERKRYDYLYVLGAEASSNGICVSIGVSTLEQAGSKNTVGTGTPDVYLNYYAAYFLPKDSSVVRRSVVADLSESVFPTIPYYTFNPYANALNVLLLSYHEVQKQNGLEWLPTAIINHLFLKMDVANLAINHNWIKNRMANDYLKTNTDSLRNYEGIPVKTFTNDYGLSTVVMQSYSRYIDPETREKQKYQSYLTDICVTQYDDDGNEIWGAVLPKTQCFKSENKYYDVTDFARRGQKSYMFNDLPEQVYNRQFYSLNAYTRDKNFYIIYNDENKHFGNTLKSPGDTLYSFQNTNTCYYKVNRKKEVSKNYLFGDPAAGEYMTSFIEGADFDEKRGVYVSLVQCKKGEDVSLRMSWSRLD